MTDVRRALIGGFMFYLAAVALLMGSTVAHEYSHYVAHEGWQAAPLAFYETPADAQADLVTSKNIEVDGRPYRVENVDETTIVIYRDTLVYAFTLNLAPMALYTDGTLGATYMHTDGGQTASRVTGADDHVEHWNTVMGAPIGVAIAGLAVAIVLVAWTKSIAARAMFVAYASELGNNAHHAEALGMHAGIYTIVAQVIFGIAILATVLLSKTYRSWIAAPTTRAPHQRAPQPRPPLRFRHTDRPIHPMGQPQPHGTL